VDYEDAEETVRWLQQAYPEKHAKVVYLYASGRYGVVLDWSIGPMVLADLYGVRVFRMAHRSGTLQFSDKQALNGR